MLPDAVIVCFRLLQHHPLSCVLLYILRKATAVVLLAHYFIKYQKKMRGKSRLRVYPQPQRQEPQRAPHSQSIKKQWEQLVAAVVFLTSPPTLLRCESCGAKAALPTLFEMLEKILVVRTYIPVVTLTVPDTYCSTTPCRNTVVELYSYRVPWSNPVDVC